MNVYNLNKMINGWFIGDFDPSLFKTKDFEVAVKYYKKGEREKKHLHKISSEYTVIAQGKVKMNGISYETGAIILINPGEATDFEVIEDAITVVVKTPSSKNDKYIVEEKND